MHCPHAAIIRLQLRLAGIMSAILMMMMSPNGTTRVGCEGRLCPAPYSPHNPLPIIALDIIRQYIPKSSKARSIPHDKVHGWCQKSGAHLAQPSVKGASINKPAETQWKWTGRENEKNDLDERIVGNGWRVNNNPPPPAWSAFHIPVMKLSKAHNTPIIRPSKGCLLLIWMSEENDWLLLFVCVGVWEIVYICFCLSVPFTFGKCPTLPDEAALVLQQQQQWRCSGACETRRIPLFCTI